MPQITPPVCDYEGSDYQVRFWDQADRAYEDGAEAVALRRLLPPGGHRLLEVGAGAGRNTLRYTGFDKIVLLDYSRTQLQQARNRLGDGDRYLYVAGDVYRLPFAPATFDAATMIRTLHHMADPQTALQQVRTTLSPAATFILEYPNKRNLKAIARWLLRRQEWNPFDRKPVEFAPLNFDFHPNAVRTWLDEAGFTITRQLAVSYFRIDLLKRLAPAGLLVGLDSLAQWTGRWWLLSPSVFARSLAVDKMNATQEGAFWRCPVCGSLDLEPVEDGLHCIGCDRVWALRDGVYDFKEPVGGEGKGG